MNSSYLFVAVNNFGENCKVEKNPQTSINSIIYNSCIYFTKIVSSSKSVMYNHLKNMVEFFRLDEETFLLSVVIFHRYMTVASFVVCIVCILFIESLVVLTRDSELFYLLIICILIAFKV
jgi:hypothetical protein